MSKKDYPSHNHGVSPEDYNFSKQEKSSKTKVAAVAGGATLGAAIAGIAGIGSTIATLGAIVGALAGMIVGISKK